MLIASVNTIYNFLAFHYIRRKSDFNHITTLPVCHNTTTFEPDFSDSMKSYRLLPPDNNNPQSSITKYNTSSIITVLFQLQCLTIKNFSVGFTSSYCMYIPIICHCGKQLRSSISVVHKYMSIPMLIIFNPWIQYLISNCLLGCW